MIRLSNNNFVLVGSKSDTVNTNSNYKSKSKAWISLVDSNGIILWERSFLGNNFQTINSACETHKGILISGLFKDFISCDSLSIVSDSYLSGFYAYFDTLGNIISLHKAGQNASLYNIISSSNTNGKIFISGSFKDSLLISGQIFSPKYINSVFIGEISDSKQIVNISLIHSSGDLYIKSIESNDSIFCIAGSYSDSLFIKDSIINSTGKHDGFIICYDTKNNLKWIKTLNGNGDQEINDISLSLDNKCAVVGYFDQNTFIDSNVFQSYGNTDIILAYLSETGKLLWGKNIGSLSNDFGYAIKVNENNVYVSGSFIHTIALPQSNGNNLELESLSPFGNSFIAKYNQDGVLKASYNLTGISEDYCQALDIDSDEKITVAGNFYKNLVINDLENNKIEIPSNGDLDIFMFHFNDLCKDFEIDAGPDTIVCPGQNIWLLAGEQYASYLWKPDGVLNQDINISNPNTYYLTATNQYGCISSDSLIVSQGLLPVVFAGQDTILEAGQNLLLSDANISNATTHLWTTSGDGYFNNNYELITEYLFSNSDVNRGNVTLQLEANNFCSTSQDSLLVTILTDDDGVTAYPNPTEDRVTLVCKAGLTIESVLITTQSGYTILPSQTINNYFYTYDFSLYPPGTFVIYITTNNGVIVKIVNKI
jgi:hypothetical protein